MMIIPPKVPLEKVPMSQRKYVLIVSGACIVTRLICTAIAKKIWHTAVAGASYEAV